MSVAFACWDDAAARRFEPFALTRPVSEVRAGALLVRERWAFALGGEAVGFAGAAPHLASFDEPGAPTALPVVAAGTWLVHSRFAPALTEAPSAPAYRHGDRLVAVRAPRDLSADALRDLESLDTLGGPIADAAPLEGWWLAAPWDLVRHLPAMLGADVPALAARTGAKPMNGSAVRGTHPVLDVPAADNWFYFTHSYHAEPEDQSLIAAVTTFGKLPVTAAIARDNVVAVQYHPEKSQAAGLELLRQFVEWRC